MKKQACEQPESADQSAIYQPWESAEPDIITRTARSRFGIPALFPFQRLVISNILEGSGYFGPEIAEESFHRQIVILPTGSGKSLCFMLPGTLLEGITLFASAMKGEFVFILTNPEILQQDGVLLAATAYGIPPKISRSV